MSIGKAWLWLRYAIRRACWSRAKKREMEWIRDEMLGIRGVRYLGGFEMVGVGEECYWLHVSDEYGSAQSKRYASDKEAMRAMLEGKVEWEDINPAYHLPPVPGGEWQIDFSDGRTSFIPFDTQRWEPHPEGRIYAECCPGKIVSAKNSPTGENVLQWMGKNPEWEKEWERRYEKRRDDR